MGGPDDKGLFNEPSRCPCLSPSLSKFNIVPMLTDCLVDRMGSRPILSVKWSSTIGTMLNFDRDGDRHGHRDGTCKWTGPSTPSVSNNYAIMLAILFS